MKKVTISVIGGGSVFTPELVLLLAENSNALGKVEIRLADIDADRLKIVGDCCSRILAKLGKDVELIYPLSSEAAIEGSDFVLLQLRQGGQDARIQDEKLGKKYKIPFVETVSICGFSTFLRTYYEFEKLAEIIRNKAPEAWVMNFTNPAGQLTEALYGLGLTRAVGVCNGWIGMKKQLSDLTGLEEDQFFMNWKGLNHLTFTDAVYSDGRNILPDIIANLDDEHKHFPFDLDLMRNLGAIPNSYLQYYYNREKMVEKLQKQEYVRSELVKEIDAALLEQYKTVDYLPDDLKKRGGFRYSYAVVGILKSIHCDESKVHYAVVKNGSVFRELPEDAFIEAPVLVKKEGLYPIHTGSLPQYAVPLVVTMKAYERMCIKAAKKRDKTLLWEAMLMHPLIGCHSIAKPMLEDCLELNRSYIPEMK